MPVQTIWVGNAAAPLHTGSSGVLSHITTTDPLGKSLACLVVQPHEEWPATTCCLLIAFYYENIDFTPADDEAICLPASSTRGSSKVMGRQIDLRVLMKVVHNIDMMPPAGEYVTVELSGGEVHHQAQVIDSCTPERIRLKLKGTNKEVEVSILNVRSIDPSSKKPRQAQDDKPPPPKKQKTVFFGKSDEEAGKIKQAMELLGIKVTDKVTKADVHNAWVKVVKSAHPDKEGGSHQKFLDIRKAYEKLQEACEKLQKA